MDKWEDKIVRRVADLLEEGMKLTAEGYLCQLVIRRCKDCKKYECSCEAIAQKH